MSAKSTCLLLLALGACAAPAPEAVPVGPEPEVQAAAGGGPLAGQWHEIGRSFEGRSIEAATYGSGDQRVYVIGGIHGDERTGLEALPELRGRLAQDGWAGRCLVRLVRDANPDGSAERTRANARGVDLNRNFPASNFRQRLGHGAEPLSEPETTSLLEDLRAFDPHLVVVFHAAGKGPFVNFDGPAHGAAARFVEAARRIDARWRVEPDMGYPTPGSLGSLLGVDEGLPVLTIEFLRGASGEGGLPDLEAGLGAVLRGL